MSDIIKIHKFKDGKVMSENRTAYANGDYVLLSDYDKTVDELEHAKSYITQLKHDLEEMEQKHEDEIAKFKENMMSVIRDDMKPYRDPNDMKIRIAELESELEVKDNLLKIKNGLCGNDVELPCEPISVAEMLINSKIEYEPTSLQKALFKTDGKCLADKYSDDDLEQIAEHLLLYCKHNREEDE